MQNSKILIMFDCGDKKRHKGLSFNNKYPNREQISQVKLKRNSEKLNGPCKRPS